MQNEFSEYCRNLHRVELRTAAASASVHADFLLTPVVINSPIGELSAVATDDLRSKEFALIQVNRSQLFRSISYEKFPA